MFTVAVLVVPYPNNKGRTDPGPTASPPGGGREGGLASYQKGDVTKSGRLSEGTLAKRAEGGVASYQKGDVLKSGRLSEGTLAKKAEGWKKASAERLKLHVGKPIKRCTGPNKTGTCSATGPEGQMHLIGPKEKRQYCGKYRLPID